MLLDHSRALEEKYTAFCDEISDQSVIKPLRAMLDSDQLMFRFKDAVEDLGWHQEWIDMCDALRVTDARHQETK